MFRYLIFVNCEDCKSGHVAPRPGKQQQQRSCQHWRGQTVEVLASAETLISLSRISVAGLFLVVSQSSHLQQARSDFTAHMGDVIRLINEQTSCHEAIATSMRELRVSAMDLRGNVVSAIQQVEESFNTQSLSDVDELEVISIQKLYCETLHLCYQFGFEVSAAQ